LPIGNNRGLYYRFRWKFGRSFFAKANGKENINFSSEVSIGANYKTKFALIDVSFFINNSIFPDYLSGQYEIYNLEQSPDKVGEFIIQNNFYGISLYVSPKKGWLKKKNKE